MESSKCSSFLWIDPYTSNAPAGGPEQRRKVLQTAALKRKREARQQHPNSRQLPVFISSSDASRCKEPENGCGIQSEDLNLQVIDSVALRSQMTLTKIRVAPGYPPMLLQSDLDFGELSALASIEVGRYTGQRIVERPGSIANFLGGTTWSYCRYVPYYYTQSLPIRTATDCVVARARHLLTPEDTHWEVLALTSYTNALSVLQKAINTTEQYPTTEVLCATLILSLYELLNRRRDNAWTKHVAGAASIIMLRGPSGYASDFEKSLFMSHVGPIVTEAILENQSCFLDDPDWIGVLYSIITDDPSVPERSTILVSLITLLVRIPRLFRDFTKEICDHPESHLSVPVKLLSRAHSLRLAFQNWYSTHIGSEDPLSVGTSVGDGYYKLLVLFYLCKIYTNRLSTCIYWAGTPGIEDIEDETQQYSKTIVSFCRGDGALNLQSSLILAQKLPIAEATVESSDEWKQEWRNGVRGRLFKVPEQTFKNWCIRFGRKTS